MPKTRRSTRRRAFTLIEVMMVISVISVLFAISTPSIIQARERTRTRSCIRNLRNIDGVNQARNLERNLPATTTAAPVSTLTAEGYLKSTPACPSGGTYSPSAETYVCNVGTPHILP